MGQGPGFEYVQTLSARRLEEILKEGFIGEQIVVFTADSTHTTGVLTEVHHGYIVLVSGTTNISVNGPSSTGLATLEKSYIASISIVSFGRVLT